MEAFAKVLVFLCLAVAVTKAAVIVYAQPNTNAHFLGTVDGKSYFSDHTVKRDWNASKAYCESIGMKLASIRTTAEKEFFLGLDDPNFKDLYWTAGRDVRTPVQFGWDDDGEPLSADLVTFYFYEESLTCVGYYTYQSDYYAAKKFFSRPCNVTLGALCESRNDPCAPAEH